MKFVNPQFLWAFLLLAIPIIVHLFHFKRYKTIYFSSIQFLKAISEESKSTQKLKHWLILLSRLLAFSALILAFAQPYIPSSEEQLKGRQTAMVFYLDNSFSMSAKGASGNLLQQGKEVIRNFVEKAPLSTNFMLVTNDLNSSELRLITKNELLDRLDEIDFSPVSVNLGNPLQSISNYLKQKSIEGTIQKIVLSDFQTVSSSLEDWEADSTVLYYPIQLQSQLNGNLYIDSVWFETPIRKMNRPNRLMVRVVNTYTENLQNIPVELKVGSFSRKSIIDIPAQASTVTSFTYTDNKVGTIEGKVEVSDEHLFFDDVFYFAYDIKENCTVLIVEEPILKQYHNAPQRVYQTDDFYKINKISIQQLTLEDTRNADFIVLNGLISISSGIQSLLEEFVNNGGGLLVIPDEKIEIAEYNALFQRLEMPRIGGFSENTLRITQLKYEDDFFEGVFEKRDKGISLSLINALFKSDFSASNAVKLLALENQDAIFARHGGEKNVFVFYAGTAPHFGTISSHAIFSALLLRSAELSSSNNLIFANLGSSKPYTIELPSNQEGAIRLKQEDFTIIPPAMRKGKKMFISLDETELLKMLHAGFYNVEWKEEHLGVIALNYNRKESKTGNLDSKEIETAFKESGAKFVQSIAFDDTSPVEQLSLEKPNEYWRILLILALVFLIIEMLLTKFWKQQSVKKV